jgi:hypothetical protein
VNISIRQKDQSEQQVKIQKVNADNNSQESGITGGNSLGNLLKEKLNNN